MKKLDRRIARTRRALSAALVELILAQGYDRLTVKEITERADVGYPTFYRHYASIDALLADVLMTELRVLKTAIEQADTPYGEAVAKYSHISRNPDIYRVYMKLPQDNEMRKMVTNELTNWFLERFRARESTSVPFELAMDHVLDACQMLQRWYLDNLEKYSAEDFAQIHSDLLLRSTTAVAIAPREDWLSRFSAPESQGSIEHERAPVNSIG